MNRQDSRSRQISASFFSVLNSQYRTIHAEDETPLFRDYFGEEKRNAFFDRKKYDHIDRGKTERKDFFGKTEYLYSELNPVPKAAIHPPSPGAILITIRDSMPKMEFSCVMQTEEQGGDDPTVSSPALFFQKSQWKGWRLPHTSDLPLRATQGSGFEVWGRRVGVNLLGFLIYRKLTNTKPLG